jgi:hypothetical protein
VMGWKQQQKRSSELWSISRSLGLLSCLWVCSHLCFGASKESESGHLFIFNWKTKERVTLLWVFITFEVTEQLTHQFQICINKMQGHKIVQKFNLKLLAKT